MCELYNLFKKLCNKLKNKEPHLCYDKIKFTKKIKRVMKKITELKVNWNETKVKLKQKFVLLTDSDLLLTEGKQDDMLKRLQVKLGKTKEEIQKIISQL
jgi:uncharacterized protein YjbJ (UPF0337 family)